MHAPQQKKNYLSTICTAYYINSNSDETMRIHAQNMLQKGCLDQVKEGHT